MWGANPHLGKSTKVEIQLNMWVQMQHRGSGNGADPPPNPERRTMAKMTLKAARVNAGYTQQKVSEIAKVSRGVVIKWEKGTASPDYLQLLGMASLYGISVDDILLPKDRT